MYSAFSASSLRRCGALLHDTPEAQPSWPIVISARTYFIAIYRKTAVVLNLRLYENSTNFVVARAAVAAAAAFSRGTPTIYVCSVLCVYVCRS